jgi:hypothetical protein
MAFLQAVKLGEAAFVLRALRPSEDRISFTPLDLDLHALRELLQTMGSVVAWAHLHGAAR